MVLNILLTEIAIVTLFTLRGALEATTFLVTGKLPRFEACGRIWVARPQP
jgi:hypothetical protein